MTLAPAAEARVIFRRNKTPTRPIIALMPYDQENGLCKAYYQDGEFDRVDYRKMMATTLPADLRDDDVASVIAEMGNHGIKARPILRYKPLV